jgi:hypothetical protein
MEYYNPDDRWEILYNITNRSDYEKRFVVRAKFHSLVPKDIIKDYEIVERLMAYSYNCYPMYDEALKKLLGMTEMAVKLRCKQLKIDLEYVDKKGKRKKRILSQLMDILLRAEKHKPLKFEFSKARKVRNIFAHPDQYAFFGAMVYHSIMQIINTINFIFTNDIDCKESSNKLEEISSSTNLYNQGNFILEYNQKRYLAYGSKCLEVHKIDNEWIYLWIIYPVVTNIKEQIEQHRYGLPIYLSFKEIAVNEDSLSGIELDSENTIRLVQTSHKDDLRQFKKFRTELNGCNKTETDLYMFWLNDEMGKQLVLHRYNNYWD